jgi:cathepsin B
MFKLVVVGLVAAVASAMPVNHKSHPINSDLVAAIKERTSAWEAHTPEENPLRNYSREELLGLVGTYVPAPRFEVESDQYSPLQALPASFDPRSEKFSKCIHPIRDQAQCGSCWAFGSTEALSDRFCINGLDVVLSPQDPVSCDYNNYGCDGGYLNLVWAYFTNTGVVTEGCFPYASQSGNAPDCPTTQKCANGAAWKKYKCKGNSVVNPQTTDAIKTELYNNGPLEGAFTVYEDFFNYKSGVYYHVSGGVAGGHAIKVLGWGTENGLNYWLCANSWGASWGLSGFFKIKQGDCGINQQMYACTPNTAAAEPEFF